MRDYVVLTDTGCDLEKELRDEYNIEYIPMHFIVDGVQYDASLDWQPFSVTEYYNLMRDGKRITTAQINVEEYKERFVKYLSEGKDILYVATSSRISASINSAMTAAEEIVKDYPDAKIICVDALRACYALGLLAIRAAELKAEGKTIEENAKWIEENKLTVHMEGTVENLKWLRQAGRVSATSAFFAGILNIKPIIVADALGRNFAVEKVKGRRTSINRIADRVKEEISDVPYQRIFISHADNLEDAKLMEEAIKERLGDVKIHIGYVGPGVGSAVGPGMLSINFFGSEVTLNKDLVGV